MALQENINSEIFFRDGLFGLEDYKRYRILNIRDDIPFKYLQSVEDENIALTVVDPYILMKDYTVPIYEDVEKELDIKSDEDVYVMVVAVIPKDIKEMTANFVAPILINVKNRLGKQIIIEGNKYKVRQPIFEQFKNHLVKEG
ncbi:MAG: flagellar assembly protein FliW [Clostridiaceae bacterium]|nr:flagellar assembly protein FliW [Clostridiaceae bacterium]